MLFVEVFGIVVIGERMIGWKLNMRRTGMDILAVGMPSSHGAYDLSECTDTGRYKAKDP